MLIPFYLFNYLIIYVSFINLSSFHTSEIFFNLFIYISFSFLFFLIKFNSVMLNHSTYPTNQETTHTLELKRLRLISSYSNLLLCSTDDPQRPLLLTLPSYMPYLQKDSKQKTFPLKGPVTYLSLKCPGLIKCYSIDNSSTYIAAFDQFHMLTIFKTKGPINSWRIVYTHPLGSKILAASWFSPSKK
ncbi:hypothetical protein HMI55_002684, partial [Coelomomyces lativittatus]